MASSSRARPNAAEQRAERLLAALATRSDLRPACAAYTRALRRYDSARARIDRVRPRAHAAAATFEIAFRGWAGTVRDEKKRRATARVAALLGGVLPGSLCRRALADQVARTADLAAHIAADPSLRRDPGEVRDMLEARAALAAAVAALAAAEDERTLASAALAVAGRAFDRAWSAPPRARTEPRPPPKPRRSTVPLRRDRVPVRLFVRIPPQISAPPRAHPGALVAPNARHPRQTSPPDQVARSGPSRRSRTRPGARAGRDRRGHARPVAGATPRARVAARRPGTPAPAPRPPR